MEVIKTAIDGVFILEPRIFNDARGYFFESFSGREFEEKVCPTCGSCSGMYTANSMNCLTEALGMGLRGNGTIPAVYSERIKLAKHAGMAVMDMYRKNIRPRDIMTKDAILNALTVDMALGCSTNSMLHLPAIAHEAGVELTGKKNGADNSASFPYQAAFFARRALTAAASSSSSGTVSSQLRQASVTD